MRDTATLTEYNRVWVVGALLTLGDALSRWTYFDRAPELELVRHLRNAVAHGGNFDIRDPARLIKYPAYVRSWTPPARNATGPRILEVVPALDGTPIWDFAAIAEVLSLFQVASRYLLLAADGSSDLF